jgi:3-hydroxyisobutyrate dehydrogenase
MKHIGFIGLGHMGFPMACNLIKAGFKVTGFDLNPEVQKQWQALGHPLAPNLEAFNTSYDAVITMLQTGEQVERVCLGPNGLFSHLEAQRLYIDCSSIDVTVSQHIHAEAQKCHLLCLDAPVSGGVKGAEAGTLTIMVGGGTDTFHKAKSILSAMGKTIIHTGNAGNGQAAKICNNMILGISMIGVAEAFILSEKLGLSAEKLLEVVNQSSGQCWVTSKYPPVPNLIPDVPANNDYRPGFTTAMMLKDLNLSQHAAEAADIHTPLGHKAQEIYQEFLDSGGGELDFSGIIRYLRTRSPNSM